MLHRNSAQFYPFLTEFRYLLMWCGKKPFIIQEKTCCCTISSSGIWQVFYLRLSVSMFLHFSKMNLICQSNEHWLLVHPSLDQVSNCRANVALLSNLSLELHQSSLSSLDKFQNPLPRSYFPLCNHLPQTQRCKLIATQSLFSWQNFKWVPLFSFPRPYL